CGRAWSGTRRRRGGRSVLRRRGRTCQTGERYRAYDAIHVERPPVLVDIRRLKSLDGRYSLRTKHAVYGNIEPGVHQSPLDLFDVTGAAGTIDRKIHTSSSTLTYLCSR